MEILLEPLRFDVVSEKAPAKGAEGAPLEVVIFSDFECPFCQRILPDLEATREAYGEQVRLSFRQFPLHSIHPNAQKAAEASLCAQDQGKFWEMHDALFEHPKELGVPQLKARAAEVGLDQAAFDACLDGDTHREAVMADLEAGKRAGVGGTPTIYVNGRQVPLTGSNLPPRQTIAKVIDDELGRLARR